jgi:hypothetical protein
MAATRVRVVFEFRNGDGNYLNPKGQDSPFVASDGLYDQGALDAAYLVACERLMETSKRELKTPSHD